MKEYNLCDLRFSRDCNYKRHIKDVHENPQTYKCQLCEKVYKQDSSLRKHVKNVHEKVKAPTENDLCSQPMNSCET